MELGSEESVSGQRQHPKSVTYKTWKSKVHLLLKSPSLLKKSHAKKISRSNRPKAEDWSQNLPNLLTHEGGLASFQKFLRSEFCEENLEFWLACEDFRQTKSAENLHVKAKGIYEDFICEGSPKEVNLDFYTRKQIGQRIERPTISCFEEAQKRIYYLMDSDSYPRFLQSDLYRDQRASQEKQKSRKPTTR